MAAQLGIGALKLFMKHRKGGKDNNTTVAGTKPPMAPQKKVRIALVPTLIISALALLLTFLLVFAGSKPGQMEDMHVFTVNVSRIGGELHQKVDGAIAGFNVDALHINLKRSVPIGAPASITAPPTTFVTMAPRADIGSTFNSLTHEAGGNVESAKSAAESKASDVKSAAQSKASDIRSKASSAANSVQSSVNSGLDSAAKKIKDKLTELVDETFKDIIAKLNLKDFYSVHIMATCEGEYVGKNEHDKQVDACKKDSPLNPMQFIAFFYWAGIICTCVAHLLNIMTIFKPGGKWISWATLFYAGATAFMLVGSALAHAVASEASKLINFIGDGISIDAIEGKKFIGITWAATFMLLIVTLYLYAFKKYLARHPEKVGSSAVAAGMMPPPVISRPMPQRSSRDDEEEAYQMKEFPPRSYEAPGTPPAVPLGRPHGSPSTGSSCSSSPHSSGHSVKHAQPPNPYNLSSSPQHPQSTFDSRGPQRTSHIDPRARLRGNYL